MAARILVVEANDDLRTLIVDILTTDGYEIANAPHGAEALRLLEERSYDLILSDLTMPAVSGAALYWEIGSRWPQLAARLICVSDGASSGVSDHQILRAASVPFLVKPFLPQHLRDLVRRRLIELNAHQRRPDPSHPAS